MKKRRSGSSGKQVNIYFQKISFGFGQLTWEDNYWYFYSWWRELISKGMRFLINSTQELLAVLVLGDDDDGLSRKYLRSSCGSLWINSIPPIRGGPIRLSSPWDLGKLIPKNGQFCGWRLRMGAPQFIGGSIVIYNFWRTQKKHNGTTAWMNDDDGGDTIL